MSNGGPVLGIDLGTTNSVVSVAQEADPVVLTDADNQPLIPSVVSFHPSGEILVGSAARERRLLDAKNTVYSVKRLIGRPFSSEEVKRARQRFPFELKEGPNGGVMVVARGEAYTLSEISAFVLRQVRTQAEEALEAPCTRAVITVPANFNELQRSATKAAGRVAGLEVLRILNEPTAAALAYGYGRGSRERIAIYDLGGGTFDLTIIELAGDVFEVLATAGDTYLGGDDVDALIADKMADAFLEHHRYDARDDTQAFERLRAAAEWAKCQLSSQPEVQLKIEELAYGDGGVSLDLAFGLTRKALERMAQSLLARTFDVCEDAMRIAGIRPTQLDNVILVGGSTRMPLVRKMVAEYFGREPMSNIDPDLVVAMGAAIQARALTVPRAQLPKPRPMALGRVALRKMSRADLEAVDISPDTGGLAADDPPTKVAGEPYRGAATDPDEQPTRVGGQAYRPPQPSGFQDADGVADFDDELTMAEGDELITAVHDGDEAAEAPAPPPPRRPPPPPPPVPAVVASHTFAVGQPEPPLPPPPPPPPVPQATAPAFAATALDLGDVAMDIGLGDIEFEPSSPVEVGAFPSSEAGALPPPDIAPPDAQHVPQGPPPMAGPAAVAPLLLDVTPLSLGVETVSGFCEHIIKRNAAIPVEQTRIFSTAQDLQDVVRVQICQGESRRIEENQVLGELELAGLPRAARGAVKIGVTFMIDASGVLGVRAQDLATGREQTIRINLIGGVDEEEIARMQERHAHMMGGQQGH